MCYPINRDGTRLEDPPKLFVIAKAEFSEVSLGGYLSRTEWEQHIKSKNLGGTHQIPPPCGENVKWDVRISTKKKKKYRE
jgi:hypothetical protein